MEQPDVLTRVFLRRLSDALKIPVFGLFDCNPSAVHILKTFRHESDSMSYDSYHLVTLNIKWIGLRPLDLEKYGIESQSMTAKEVKEDKKKNWV
ncbi:hypothetical protein LIER_42920 [Lithospermum erythrorhizon]|uniref:Topoisomerase 6 subunit A/Spo11 TOPRIM domain-containing protein n=1 Tax=Lithospermum erythrorhizon TaxID=34254 RepID=A0AAV3P4X4_LITER